MEGSGRGLMCGLTMALPKGMKGNHIVVLDTVDWLLACNRVRSGRSIGYYEGRNLFFHCPFCVIIFLCSTLYLHLFPHSFMRFTACHLNCIISVLLPSFQLLRLARLTASTPMMDLGV